MIFIASTLAQQIGDVGWSCGSWFVLQTPKIGFDLVLIHSNFDLVWEGNVDLLERRMH